MAVNTKGIIYYKLDAGKNGYEGDITKNCGLRGEEIDGNFHFLRGHDIKEVSFDENGVMNIVRYNGEVLSATPTAPKTQDFDFKYDKAHGTLYVITPDREIVVEGFTVATTVKHDESLEGDGTVDNVLGVANVARTGRYRPAIKLIDTTKLDENGNRLEMLPIENVAKHDRYVTKEKSSRFGRLFPLPGILKLDARLKEINSEWRVPTKKDWDTLLDAIDCDSPTHTADGSNVFLGKIAGAALKSTKYWASYEGKVLSDDTYNFTAYPVGYIVDIHGAKTFGGFGKSTAFWTSTEEDPTLDMYVKTLDYNETGVGQRTWGGNYYLSVRLVKDFTGNNFNESETIDGFTANCVHIPGTNLVWTKDNVGFSQTQYDGFIPTEWADYENSEGLDISFTNRFFVNDWNGKDWTKHELRQGEGIVLFEGPEGNNMHEWMVYNGQLVDSFGDIKKMIDDVIELIGGLGAAEGATPDYVTIGVKKHSANINALHVKLLEHEGNMLTVGEYNQDGETKNGLCVFIPVYCEDTGVTHSKDLSIDHITMLTGFTGNEIPAPPVKPEGDDNTGDNGNTGDDNTEGEDNTGDNGNAGDDNTEGGEDTGDNGNTGDDNAEGGSPLAKLLRLRKKI